MEDVGRHIRVFLDVPTLVKQKAVCRLWRALYTDTIERKASTPQPFQTGKELRIAIEKYAEYNPNDAEDFIGGTFQMWRTLTVFLTNFHLSTRALDHGIGLSNWDTSNVIDMSFICEGASSFNQDIASWDTSNVTGMSFMFEGASSFNQDISTCDISNVKYMSRMFSGALSFDQDISTSMSFMFEGIVSMLHIQDRNMLGCAKHGMTL
eukprot:scaffold12806_cov55-Attheya_sp.AAC.9